MPKQNSSIGTPAVAAKDSAGGGASDLERQAQEATQNQGYAALQTIGGSGCELGFRQPFCLFGLKGANGNAREQAGLENQDTCSLMLKGSELSEITRACFRACG